MSVLLMTLGISPAIVPEAYLLPGVTFKAVHALTTESVTDDSLEMVLGWFRSHAPDVNLSITRVAGFSDFRSESDHFHFEEVLYRWMLACRGETPPHVCLSGGFKTMSAAIQKSAAVLGASEVFHVLCDLPRQPNTPEEITLAQSNGHLHWIRLGAEEGWPQRRGTKACQYPLETTRQDGPIFWRSAPDDNFRSHLQEIVERSHHIAEAWEQIGQLPFPSLATWPAADLDWLNQRIDPDADKDWVAQLPKVELHCHLGGFATEGAQLDQVRSAASAPDKLTLNSCPVLPAGWPLPKAAISLTDYMRLGDANGSAILWDAGCLAEQCRLLYQHLAKENVVYAEIRCSPANYASPGRSPWTVLTEIKMAFDQAMQNYPGCHVNLIVIATRKEEGDFRSAISRHLALAVSASEHWADETRCRVVGVDLAGYEDESTRAHYFREEFHAIHRCGLALTVHAGENDVAEGIWRAVFDLNTRRIGHALYLKDSSELMRSVADRGIGVEMCPYANYQIKGYSLDPCGPVVAPGATYPLKQYLEAGIKVTLNTDNIGISQATLTDNFLLASRLCPNLTRLDLLRLLRNSAEVAFLQSKDRQLLIARMQKDMLPPLPAHQRSKPQR